MLVQSLSENLNGAKKTPTTKHTQKSKKTPTLITLVEQILDSLGGQFLCGYKRWKSSNIISF